MSVQCARQAILKGAFFGLIRDEPVQSFLHCILVFSTPVSVSGSQKRQQSEAGPAHIAVQSLIATLAITITDLRELDDDHA